MINVPREDIIVMLEAGYIYLAMKKYKESKNLFEGLCELAPKHDVPQVGVANVYFAQGKYLEAMRTLKKALQNNNASAYAYAHLGEAELFYGKKEQASVNLAKASELEPTVAGKSGEFARSLLNLIKMGYDPVEYRKAFKKVVDEQKKKDAEPRAVK